MKFNYSKTNLTANKNEAMLDGSDYFFCIEYLFRNLVRCFF